MFCEEMLLNCKYCDVTECGMTCTGTCTCQTWVVRTKGTTRAWHRILRVSVQLLQRSTTSVRLFTMHSCIAHVPRKLNEDLKQS